jgi:hypothetical protein
VDNPYIGTEWEQSWQQGYDTGINQPVGGVDVPAVMEQNQAQIYNEGVLAGQTDAAQGGSPVDVNPVTPAEPPEQPIELGVSAAFSLIDLVRDGAEGWLFTVVHLLITIAIPNGPPPQDLSDPAELSGALKAAASAMGAPDLYMGFCRSNSHSAIGDQVTSAGYWHSNVFIDYWAAYPLAEQHLSAEADSQGLVGLVHYKNDSDGIEWIELT